MSDPYVTLIQDQWGNICDLYNQHAEHYPVMLVDVEAAEIHALPFADFKELLDQPSQIALAEQYKRAVANRQMVLFVRDTSRKIMQSYTLQLEDAAAL